MMDNRNQVELSILVPVYNTVKYLSRCVSSLLVQTVHDIEVILVDDGSTDGAGALCDELAACDGRVRVIHQENAGASAARLAGLRASRGRYLGFVDSDDYVESDFYEHLLAPIQQDPSIEVSIGGLMKDEMDGRFSYPYNADEIVFWDDSMAAMEEMVRGKKFIWNLADKIYARRLFFDFSPAFSYVGNYSEDLYFNAMVLPHAKRIVFQPIYGYHYCMNEMSLTHQKYHEAMLPIIGLWVNLLREFQESAFLKRRLSSYFASSSIAGLALLQRNRSPQLVRYQEIIRSGLRLAKLETWEAEVLQILLYESKEFDDWKKEEFHRMMVFCRAGRKKLYIYGTGTFGQRSARQLMSLKIPFEGFVETYKSKEMCLGHHVKSLEMLSGDEYLLFGMDGTHTQEVEKILGKRFVHRFPFGKYLSCT